MNPTPDLDRVFPLSGGSSERARLRAPRLSLLVKSMPGVVLGHSAFLRTCVGRRALAQGAELPYGASSAERFAEPVPQN